MLNIWTLLAVGITIAEVVPFDICEVLLARNALIRSVTSCAANGAWLASELLILVFTCLAIIGGLFPKAISFSVILGNQTPCEVEYGVDNVVPWVLNLSIEFPLLWVFASLSFKYRSREFVKTWLFLHDRDLPLGKPRPKSIVLWVT